MIGLRKSIKSSNEIYKMEFKMRNMHKFEELLPEEFDSEKQRSPIIYCAFGPVEYHGCYNALGVDPGKAYEICLRAAEITGGIVFPMVPIAPGGSMSFEKMSNRDKLRKAAGRAYPTVCTSIEICEKLYYELFETFAEDLGFKLCVAFGGHGPAGTLIEKIAEEHNGEIKGMTLLPSSSLSHNLDIIKEEYKKLGIEHIVHGGLWETAMNMGCNMEYVQVRKTAESWPDKYQRYPEERLHEIGCRSEKEISEFGEKLLQVSAERIASEANSLLDKVK